MSYDDSLTVTNYPRYHARKLIKAIRSLNSEQREVLAARILFQTPLVDRNTELVTHIVALLQNKRPRTSLEKLLREHQNTKQSKLASTLLSL